MAGDLAKVQPLLQRLHLLEKPKKRFGGRNVILVSSVLGAVALALAAVAVLRRRGRLNGAVADRYAAGTVPPELGAPKITKTMTTTSVPPAPNTVCRAAVAKATAIITRVKSAQSTRNLEVGIVPSTGPARASVRSAPMTAAMASDARRLRRVVRPPNAIAIVDER